MNSKPDTDEQKVSRRAGPASAWRARLRARTDSELEQSLVRIGLASAVFIYLMGSVGLSPVYGGIAYVSTAYLLFSFGVTVFAVISPSKSVVRRYAGTAGDIIAVSYANIVAGEICAPFYGGYLWISIANGFRFGRRYLYVTTTMAGVAFGLVLLWSPYWIDHRLLGVGLLLWLALLPMYVGVLLKRLEVSLARAREADKAKTQFLANMSHELRTPLHAIIGYSQLLKDEARENRNTAGLADLDKIETAGQQLLGLINGVLDLSRIEAGKMDVAVEEIALRPELERALQSVQPGATSNGNRLVLEYNTSLETVHTDPVRLRQILLNLLSNACKFTRNGTVMLRVQPEPSDAPRDLVLRVEDDGIGIEESQLVCVFQPFHQADSSTTRRYGGTGLGLALSKGLCKLLGGSISVTSKPGRGSVFTVRLPLQTVRT